MNDEEYNQLIDKIKNLLTDRLIRTEYDYNCEYLPYHEIREIMDSLYIPSRLNKLCKYEYSCGSYGDDHNCKSCKDNFANKRV